MKPGISAVVVVYNQGELLEKCLASLTWVDEIVVVDLESTDNIKSIATKFKAAYHKVPHVDVVEEVRQKSLTFASNEYVLLVDADETIPVSLADKLREVVGKSHPAYVKMPRQNFIFGKWYQYTEMWPDYQMRLLKKSQVSWPNKLHAQPMIDGEGVTLEISPVYAIRHTNYQSIDQWLEKNRRYAKKEARELLDGQGKYTLLQVIEKSVGQITSRFFQGFGYKDGIHGLILSFLQFFYYFMVYAYYWELQKYPESEDESSIYHFPHNVFRHGFAETLFWDNEKASGITKLKQKLVRKMIG
jgi:glycosyltransferase involved in cell wall biosynthesis